MDYNFFHDCLFTLNFIWKHYVHIVVLKFNRGACVITLVMYIENRWGLVKMSLITVANFGLLGDMYTFFYYFIFSISFNNVI